MASSLDRTPGVARIRLGVAIVAPIVFVTSSFAGENDALPPSRFLPLPATVATVIVPPVDSAVLIEDDLTRPSYLPYRFGIELPVDLNPTNCGEWFEVGRERVWRVRIESQEAFSLHVLFDTFALVPGGRLYAYVDDPRVPVEGPITARANRPDGYHATAPLPGGALTIEYIEPIDGPRGVFNIERLVHAYRDAFGFAANGAMAGTAGASAPCHVNVACPEAQNFYDVRAAVAKLILGGGSCSGSLLNNTKQDGDSLFLTANHCKQNSGVPTGQWVFLFNYESPTCIGSSGPATDSVAGATLIANSTLTDFCLVRINPPIQPTFYPYFEGFDASDAAITETATIHHPAGDVKKFSRDTDPPNSMTTTLLGASMDVWNIAKWEIGFLEPGSSGAPLFDQNKRAVGQLWGGATASSCANPIDSYYGRFATTFGNSAVAAALDPLGTGALTMPGIDGTLVLSVDLAAVGVTAPATVEVGEFVQVARDVQTVGTYPPATFGYQIRISSDTTIDASDLVIDAGTSASYGLDASEIQIPLSTPPGDYFLGLTVDTAQGELDTTDNVFSGAAITVNPSSAPDYQAIAISGPASAFKGETITVDLETAGNGAASPNHSVDVRMTGDDIVGINDPLLGVVTLTSFGPKQAQVKVPVNMTAGVYRIAILVKADPNEIVVSDNSALGGFIEIKTPPPPPPDVSAIAIDGPAKAKISKKAKVSVELDKGSYAGKVKYTIRLSTDPVITTEDLAVKSYSTKKSGVLKVEPKIPSMAPGIYYWGVTIDSITDEVDFTDNSVLGEPVEIKPKP